jgi:hypothetical protein
MSWGKQVEGQMTRLRNIVLGGLAALAIGGAASSASAIETADFTNRLSGATIGLPLGALPPPGLYTGLETAYLGMIGSQGKSTGNQSAGFLPAISQAVPILWVPGWNFLGASYAMSVVLPFYNANACAVSCGLGEGNNFITGPITSSYVTANTFWSPLNLSWNLGGGWFASVSFNFVAPDGTHTVGTVNPDYWTYEPAFAIAYLANNWNLAGNFFYDINGASKGTCCVTSTITTGNLLYGDLEALYKIGKWSLGPVGSFEVQTTADTGCAIKAFCAKATAGTVGGLVGYDFGPVDLQFWATYQVAGTNFPEGVGGINLWTRLGFRLWAPEAPKPLVAKN